MKQLSWKNPKGLESGKGAFRLNGPKEQRGYTMGDSYEIIAVTLVVQLVVIGLMWLIVSR